MELKYGRRARKRSARSVLIAPLWNWNIFRFSLQSLQKIVLIAPLWNWNEGNLFQEDQQPPVLIAPLWNWNLDSHLSILCRVCSNRTFMELKWYEYPLFTLVTTVLIAPLWNWNRGGWAGRYCDPRSNRTFMELKSISVIAKKIWCLLF